MNVVQTWGGWGEGFFELVIEPLTYLHDSPNMQYLTETASTGGSPSFLIAIYQRLFGSNSHQNIVRYNDFTNVASYFLQKVRIVFEQCLSEITITYIVITHLCVILTYLCASIVLVICCL